jgi:hypothetical protein
MRTAHKAVGSSLRGSCLANGVAALARAIPATQLCAPCVPVSENLGNSDRQVRESTTPVDAFSVPHWISCGWHFPAHVFKKEMISVQDL